MPDTSTRQAEIAVEQAYLDRVYARLAEIRSEAEALRDKGYELAHGAAREAIFEQASMLHERDALVQHANRMLRALDTEHEGLVFGRLDFTGDNADNDGAPLYIGRLGVRSSEFENLVTDWRAPAAAAFYQATAEEPMGVLRRRVIRSSAERVLDVDDDLLIPDALPDHIKIIGEGVLLAALSRARGDTMRDIVATIQREQDMAIRAPGGGVTEITGGPGTGKTAVALHRVAYLLYSDRRRLGGAGVLVIGPSPVFMTYIARVLPSMGEDTAELRALGEVMDGARATHLDPGPVAAVKGSLRMRKVLRAALRDAPPDAPSELRVFYRGEVLKLVGPELERVRRKVHSRGGLPNRIRVRAAEALLEALWRKAEQYEGFTPDHDELVTDIGERIEFHRFLVAWWPPLSPAGVLGWLADPRRLARAARRELSQDEVELLAKSWSRPGFSVADIALLDELRVMLGEPKRRRAQQSDEPASSHRPANYDEYSHVVVDEAQDLSPMQWRMIGRRGKYASWTIVGDPVQTSWPDPAESTAAKDEALGSVRARRDFTLRTNYRNSHEIFALAAKVLDGLVDPAELPHAVRTTGIEPSIRRSSDLSSDTVAAAKELLDAVEGTVGVITTMARADQVRDWLSGVADDRLRVLGSLEAKGMEYDAVAVVEPGELAEESTTGRRALYVALTRATQQLTVLTTSPEWHTTLTS